jgi:F-type H+-transporting ATPase subunit b
MEQLGIEPVQLITQIVNFVIMAVLLTRFLYKPILKMLAERRAKIAEGLAYTEKMKSEVEKTEAHREKILRSAKEEGGKIIEEAKKSGKQIEAEIIEKAHTEAAAIIAKGKEDVLLERADMQKKLKDQTVDIAEAIAKKVLSSVLSDADHEKIIEKKIRVIAQELA